MIRRTPAFTRTATFRFTALVTGVFALSAGFILILIYISMQNTLARRTDAAIAGEVEVLTEAYRGGGLNGLNQAVAKRSLTDQDFLYILAYPQGERLSGSLDGLPLHANEEGVLSNFVYTRIDDNGVEERRRARGFVEDFAGGFRLLVGRDFHDDARFLSGMANTAWTATGFVLLLALGSGIFVSRRFAQRLERLNAVVRGVGGGDLHRRAVRNYTGDELDELAGNLNSMLDRIEHLMAAMRHAGDSIAHDLRSPLTRLRARLEAARAEADSEADAEAITTAVTDVDELLGTFDAVMRIARLEAGEKRPALAPLDLGELAADIGDLYCPACEEKELELSLETPSDLTIKGDRALLSQAVANLLDNAIKYTPEGGAIALRTRQCSDGRIEVSVTDTGPGIPVEARERVRQRFVRLDASRSAAGVGLGLSLVEAVADIHNAELVLDDGPGMVDGRGPGLRAALVFPAQVKSLTDSSSERRTA